MTVVQRFRTWDDIEIAYRLWGERDQQRPVVLHHGFVANAHVNWELTGVVAALLDAGRWVLAPDARGHGDSDKPHDSSRYGEPNMARDLEALLGVLEIAEIDLAGYSMGAVVALLLASAHPAVVRRLVIGGVGSGIVECGGVDRRVVSNDEIIRALQIEDPESLGDSGARGFRMLADGLGADRVALLAQASAIHRGGVALERISAPTLVLAGDSDPLAVRPEVLVAAIPDARLQLLGGDHMAAVGDPAFAPAIVDFLS
jgi:pimeloyl-ACP methyl ester carboxylesterase